MLCRFMGPTRRLANATVPTRRTNCLGKKKVTKRNGTIAATRIATEARLDPKAFREAQCDENFRTSSGTDSIIQSSLGC
jgi:hypothetical protein